MAMLPMKRAPKAMAAVRTVMATGGKRRKSRTLRGSMRRRLRRVVSFLVWTLADSAVVILLRGASGSGSSARPVPAVLLLLRGSVSGRSRKSNRRQHKP
jgi:hypothetical protein